VDKGGVMKKAQILHAVVLATLMAFSLSLAESPAATNAKDKQVPNTCMCNGKMQNNDQNSDKSGSTNGSAVTPKTDKKRTVDQVNWEKVFGETG
jgi:hypothetical protein